MPGMLLRRLTTAIELLRATYAWELSIGGHPEELAVSPDGGLLCQRPVVWHRRRGCGLAAAAGLPLKGARDRRPLPISRGGGRSLLALLAQRLAGASYDAAHEFEMRLD
jgi:hypothetical protein